MSAASALVMALVMGDLRVVVERTDLSAKVEAIATYEGSPMVPYVNSDSSLWSSDLHPLETTLQPEPKRIDGGVWVEVPQRRGLYVLKQVRLAGCELLVDPEDSAGADTLTSGDTRTVYSWSEGSWTKVPRARVRRLQEVRFVIDQRPPPRIDVDVCAQCAGWSSRFENGITIWDNAQIPASFSGDTLWVPPNTSAPVSLQLRDGAREGSLEVVYFANDKLSDRWERPNRWERDLTDGGSEARTISASVLERTWERIRKDGRALAFRHKGDVLEVDFPQLSKFGVVWVAARGANGFLLGYTTFHVMPMRVSPESQPPAPGAREVNPMDLLTHHADTVSVTLQMIPPNWPKMKGATPLISVLLHPSGWALEPAARGPDSRPLSADATLTAKQALAIAHALERSGFLQAAEFTHSEAREPPQTEPPRHSRLGAPQEAPGAHVSLEISASDGDWHYSFTRSWEWSAKARAPLELVQPLVSRDAAALVAQLLDQAPRP